MPIAKKEMLVKLIRTLSRAEKSYFTGHYQARNDNQDDLYYRLFLLVNSGKDPADPVVRKKLGVTDSVQMANLQRHLYSQLLDSLRQQHRRHDPVVQVQEDVDYAHLLYERGLHLQALILLRKAKKRAAKYHLDLHHLTILEFEKMIQARHITRSGKEVMKTLTEASERRRTIFSITSALDNLQLRLQRHFIEHGHVTSPEAKQDFRQNYSEALVIRTDVKATFRERIAFYRALFWYHYVTLELDEAYAAALYWVAEYGEDSEQRYRDTHLFLKGIDRCAMLSFLQDNPSQHARWQRKTDDFAQAAKLKISRSANNQLAFLQLRMALDRNLLTRTNATPVAQIVELHQATKQLEGLDNHQRLLLYYKIGLSLTRSGAYDEALDAIAPILDDRKPLRQELMVYSRLLFLACHLHLKNFELVNYGINNLNRYLGRIAYPSAHPKSCLTMLRALLRWVDPATAAKEYSDRRKQLAENPAEFRDLHYLNFQSLLAS